MTSTPAWLLVAVSPPPTDRRRTHVQSRSERRADLPALLARAKKDGTAGGHHGSRGLSSRCREASSRGRVIPVFGSEESPDGSRPTASTSLANPSIWIGRLHDLECACGCVRAPPTYRRLRVHAREFGFNQAFPGEPWHFTHYLPPGSAEGPAPGTVRHGRSGTVLRRAPDTRQLDPAVRVLIGDAIAWLPAIGTIVYTQCWREEGGGGGCAVKWESRRDRLVTRTIPVFLPGDADTEALRRARLIKAHAAIAPLLDGAILLDVGTWADLSSWVSVGRGEHLSWDPGQSSLEVPGKPPHEVKSLAPWVAKPIGVYTNPDLDFVVVELGDDPRGGIHHRRQSGEPIRGRSRGSSRTRYELAQGTAG